MKAEGPKKLLSEAYRKFLAQPVSPAIRQTLLEKRGLRLEKGATAAEAIAAAVILRAIVGDVESAKEICDRVEGRPKRTVEIGPIGAEQEPFEFRVVYSEPCDPRPCLPSAQIIDTVVQKEVKKEIRAEVLTESDSKD